MTFSKYLLLLFSTSIFSTTSFSQWNQTGGPKGGYTDDIVKAGNTLFLAAQSGGVYISNNNGNSWDLSISGLPQNPHIYAMYETNDIVYVACSRNGVYQSTNYGNSWISTSNQPRYDTFYSLFVQGDDIYGGQANGGILYSPDNGATWLDKSEGIADIQFQDIIGFNSKIYVGGSSLFETSDNGDTWTVVDIPGLSINGVNALYVHDGIFYAAGVGEVFVSSDNMISWQQANIYPSGSVTSMNSSDGLVYLTTSNGKYFTTDDNGENWTQYQNAVTESFALGLLFTNDKIIMTTAEGVYESFDNGTTWSLNNTGIKALTIESIGRNSDYLFAGTTGQGIFRSEDEGQNWSLINNGIDALNAGTVSDIVTVNETLFIATGGGIYVSDDHGDSWVNKFAPGTNKSTETLDFDDGVFATTVNGTGVFISTDMGDTWVLAETDGFNVETSYSSIILHGNTVVVANHSGELMISTDLGDSWSNISIPGNFYFTYKLLLQDGKLYAATARGLWISDDLGQNWERLPTYNYDSVQDVLVDGDLVIAATSSGIQISEAGRKFWYPATEGMGAQWATKLLLKGDNLYVGTYSSSIWVRPIAEMFVPPLDDDGDGIANEEDFCSNTPFGQPVNDVGCAQSQLDDDNDGITNDIDILCPNTAEGVVVDTKGCDLIASDAIKIYSKTPTCPDAANGRIEISSSLKEYNYNIMFSGEGRTENHFGQSLAESLVFEDLAAGNYDISISISDIFYTKMVGVVIGRTSTISGKRLFTDKSSKSTSYKVSGSKEYTVEFNGRIKTFSFDTTSEQEIKIVGLKTKNNILITGKSYCQGKIEDAFSLIEGATVYPTFTSGNLFIVNQNVPAEVSVYYESGQLILHQKLEALDKNAIDLGGYIAGLYIVQLKSNGTITSYKIIKK